MLIKLLNLVYNLCYRLISFLAFMGLQIRIIKLLGGYETLVSTVGGLMFLIGASTVVSIIFTHHLVRFVATLQRECAE